MQAKKGKKDSSYGQKSKKMLEEMREERLRSEKREKSTPNYVASYSPI